MGFDMMQKTLIHLLLVVIMFGCASASQATKLDVGDPVPEFSALGKDGAQFNYPSDANGIMLTVFISPAKTQSVRALSDVERMVNAIEKSPKNLSVLFVLEDDPNSFEAVKIKKDVLNEKIKKHLVIDNDYKFWGIFGVIASPTVFVVGPDQKILFVKAGYGYDFAPAVKSKLLVALGVNSEDTFSKIGGVKTARNDTVKSKAARHLQMARMLLRQKKHESALEQLELAVQIDPNSVDASLELGRLYCTLSEPQKAIDAVSQINPAQKMQQAERNFILGKGHFLLNEYTMSEKFLLESLELNPNNSEAYYLLGRTYHIQNESEKALQAYYKSLRLLYGEPPTH